MTFRFTIYLGFSTVDLYRSCSLEQSPLPRALCGLLTLAVLAVLPVGQVSALEYPPADEVTERLEQTTQLLRDIGEVVPVDISKNENLADELDYDYDSAIDFVRNSIRFEPYAGVMKGVEGTASTLGGNAWDQALLLASLINTMGGEAQVVWGKLDSAGAEALLDRTFATYIDASPAFAAEALAVLLGDYDPNLAKNFRLKMEGRGAPVEAVDIGSQVRDISQRLLTVAKPPLSQGRGQLLTMLAADYAWVRWRDGPASEWQSVHPVFTAQSEPEAQVRQYLAGEVPDNFLHKITINLEIERRIRGGKVEREALMAPFSRPTAQLFKRDLSIALAPMPGADGSSESASLLIPLLNGALPGGAKAVNALGLTVDASNLGGGSADYFAQLSQRMGSAIGALDGAGAKAGSHSMPALKNAILGFELISPGVEARYVERKMGASSEAIIAFPYSVAFSSVINTSIGVESSTRRTHQLLTDQAASLNASPLVLAMSRDLVDAREAAQSAQIRGMPNPNWVDADIYGSVALPVGEQQLRLIRPSSFVIARHTLSGESGGVKTYSDIVFNEVLALRKQGEQGATPDTAQALAQGVRETVLESHLVNSERRWAARLPTKHLPAEADIRAMSGDGGWTVEAVDAALADQRRGFFIVASSEPNYWWRVDPTTGNTLGMGIRGGQSLAEEATQVVVGVAGSLMSAYFFKQSVESCDDTYKDNKDMADCCIVGNLVVTGGSAVAGGMSGGLPVGKVGGAAFSNAPWLTSLGYITAQLQIDFASNMLTNAVMEKSIDSACRAYLEK